MQFQKAAIEIGQKNKITRLWSRYFPYWPLFLLLILCFFASAWIYLRYTLPQFRASTTLLIKDESKGIDDSKMIESLHLISTKKTVENEIEVIKSRGLMSTVVNKLRLYAPVFTEDKWADKPAYATSPVKIELQIPDSAHTGGKCFFRYDIKSRQIFIQNKRYSLNNWVNTPYGIVRFTPTNVPASEEQVFYFTILHPKKVMFDLIKKLNVSVSKLSTVLTISISDEVPARAEDILNELILAYNMAAADDKDSLAANTLSFLQERLNFASEGLNSIERRIEQYKSGKGAVDIGSQGKLFLETVSVNDQKLSDINMQLAVLDQVEKYISAKDNNEGIVPSTLGISDPVLTQLLNKHYESVLEYAKLKKVVARNNPMLISIADQIEQIKPGILENIQSQRRSLTASKTNLSSTNDKYAGLLQSIPQKERDLVNISRQQNIQGNIYSFLLQKREEAALSYSSIVADNRLVDKAQSSLSPVSPNTALIYLLSFAFALAAGIGLITGMEFLATSILYRQEIESLTSIPVISEISYENSNKSIVTGEGKTSFIAEQFRKLRATLSASGISDKHKKILITSSIAGEGKSFITANLGLSLALSGRKTVLVEFDVSHPSLSEKLNIATDRGWGAYLTGKARPEEIIKRTALHENLFIIPAGELPHDPSDLMTGERIVSLLNYLESIFDYILLDTAPVTVLSDAYVLAPCCDRTLYIIRHGYTPIELIERLDDTNKINELKNMNIIFNGVRSRGFSRGEYTFGYEHQYKQNKKQKPAGIQ
ncbi:MAG TPA: polysaccharide biosynthesis tyrosine autokinase [Chitinophagaceae bacterium]|nr:polysaccharide biosynthesis tyrosine autokinase [Chitinophagaceae bacterium]